MYVHVHIHKCVCTGVADTDIPLMLKKTWMVNTDVVRL